MTDKKIVQALRRCQFGAPCARCPAVSYKNCMDEMHKCAADLIERLTAENAALREKQRRIAGIEAREYTSYQYFGERGEYVGDDNEMLLEDILDNAGVEVRDA